MLKFYVLFNILICLLGFSQTSFAQPTTINFSELEVTINEELKATNTPGAAVAVVIGDHSLESSIALNWIQLMKSKG